MSLLPCYAILFLLPVLPVPAQVPLQLESSRGPSSSPLYTAVSTSSSSSSSPVGPFYRLNNTFIPSHYELQLLILLDSDPQLGEQFTAPGKVWIDASPTAPTTQITLHAYTLRVNYASLRVESVDRPEQTIRVTGTNNQTNGGVQFLTIAVDTTLQVGALYRIYMEFIAPISTDNNYNGLYLSTYVDKESGETRRLAATQMESIHARKLFPCFDEPALKATFNVSIIRKSNYTSLANSNLLASTPDPSRPGFIIDRFNQTVPMSTYLFAIVVSDMRFVEAELPTFGGKPVRVHAPPAMIAAGGGLYSARMGAELLQFYDDYFQALYPLSKMDLAAIPQFGPGAMENYGLNLYRESLLIYYPGETLESSRNSITSVLAHELGHQNFGDWVSLNWWTQIWLNEGFASYVANIGVDHVAPEFKAREDAIGQMQNSMVADVAPNSHPLQNNVPDTEPDSHVGAITYDKGASINRMTENFLTEATYQKGLRLYLQDMKFKAAHSDDLFRNLQIAAAEDARLPQNLTIKMILDTWTTQRGHPLVRVVTANSTSVCISQEKYAHPEDALWYVPLTIVTRDRPVLQNNVPEVWMSPSSPSINLTHPTASWIMVNQNGTGYYRVLYDAPLSALIQEQLQANASIISPLSRSQLLDDYFTLAFRDLVELERALNMTIYLEQEDHFTVWNVLFNHLRKSYTLLGSFSTFRGYLLPRLEKALEKVGLEESPSHIGQNAIYRAKLLDWACSMEHPACFSYAQKLFAQWLLSPSITPVNINVQSVLHCAIVASGNWSAYDFTFNRFLALRDEDPLKPRLLNALACAREEGILQDLIEKGINVSSGLGRGDASTVLQRVALNRAGKALIFLTLERRTAEIISNVGGGSANPVASIVSSLSSSLSTTEDLSRLQQFITDNSAALQPVNGSLQGSLNNVIGNIEWMGKYGGKIRDWMEDQVAYERKL